MAIPPLTPPECDQARRQQGRPQAELHLGGGRARRPAPRAPTPPRPGPAVPAGPAPAARPAPGRSSPSRSGRPAGSVAVADGACAQQVEGHRFRRRQGGLLVGRDPAPRRRRRRTAPASRQPRTDRRPLMSAAPSVVDVDPCGSSDAGAGMAPGPYSTSGSSTTNRAPPPTRSSTQTWPWWRRACSATSDRPRPVPSPAPGRLDDSPRANRSKMWCRSCSRHAGPPVLDGEADHGRRCPTRPGRWARRRTCRRSPAG